MPVKASFFEVPYSTSQETIRFDAIFTLFHPVTIDASYQDQAGNPIGIKDSKNKWNKAGSRDRIISVDEDYLLLCKALLSAEGNHAPAEPLSAELVGPYSSKLVDALRALKSVKTDESWQAIGSPICNEKAAKAEGAIHHKSSIAEPDFPSLLSGPNITSCCCIGQHAMQQFKSMRSYLSTDLTSIPFCFRPRTQYQVKDLNKFESKYNISLPDGSSIVSSYRVAFRTMLSPNIERTVQAAILPPGYSHVYSITSVATQSVEDLVLLCGYLCSLPIDFYVRVLGKTALYVSDIDALPVPRPREINAQLRKEILARSLALNALTASFEDLWLKLASVVAGATISRIDNQPGLQGAMPNWKQETISPDFSAQSALRSHEERRQALVELDVLCAMSIGLSMEMLEAIYRVQFPVMQQYEIDTWYDRNGRIVFTSSLGMPGVGFARKSKGKGLDKQTGWEEIADTKAGIIYRSYSDESLPGEPVTREASYSPPWHLRDRIKDYRDAWKFFVDNGISK